MTSTELVDFINSQRGAGESELRHDHFMAKVPKVLGEHAPKFRDMIQVTVGNGATRESPIYCLPKREACLMAMSYSYELQAQLLDVLTPVYFGIHFGSCMRYAKQLSSRNGYPPSGTKLDAASSSDA
ncbi:MAG: hypothetical protein Q8L99_04630 [Polycyclovorans sp.]|nr:hypothetical protein [Polycyclovorans sp.]